MICATSSGVAMLFGNNSFGAGAITTFSWQGLQAYFWSNMLDHTDLRRNIFKLFASFFTDSYERFTTRTYLFCFWYIVKNYFTWQVSGQWATARMFFSAMWFNRYFFIKLCDHFFWQLNTSFIK